MDAREDLPRFIGPIGQGGIALRSPGCGVCVGASGCADCPLCGFVDIPFELDARLAIFAAQPQRPISL